MGKVDAVRKRDGEWIAYEHKRGRCCRGEQNEPLAWSSDRIQVIAYAALVEEQLGEPVRLERVRYHADNVTAMVTIDDNAREELCAAIRRGIELRTTTDRPPVAENERLCRKCSLAVVCLPEEEREPILTEEPTAPRLFPSNRERHTLHVTAPNARIGKSGEALVVQIDDQKEKIPIEQIDSILIHGYGQVSTQALHLCSYRGVAVSWMTMAGRFVAGVSASPGRFSNGFANTRLWWTVHFA